MTTPIRIAVLSFWHVHAGDYSKSAVTHPDTELVAVWDDDEARGREGAERFGAEYAPDLDALLARDDIDAVAIVTPTDVHRDIMVKAANAGKHIFTEKLLAPTVEEAEEIVAACDANGVKLIVSLPRLYAGYTAAIREQLDSGALGRITYARVRLSHDGGIARDGAERGWLPDRFFDPKPSIGGALTDLGCHPVYLTQLLLGARPHAVSAVYTHVTGREVEDNAVVTAGYEDGAIGVIEAGFASNTPFTIDLVGTDGALHYTDSTNTLTGTGRAFDGGPADLSIPADSPDAWAQWVDHIRQGTRADDNIARAVELTRLVVAANRSAAEHQAVPVA